MPLSKCIICQQHHSDETVEHIVPRSLGNIHYILPKGMVCQRCNQRFSKYEYEVLNSAEWLECRKQRGLVRNNVPPLERPLKDTTLFKFLLKIFFESMYFSQSHMLQLKNFEPLRLELTGQQNLTFEIFKNKRLNKSKSIPGWVSKWRLSANAISLRYRIEENDLFFHFRFDLINTVLAIKGI